MDIAYNKEIIENILLLLNNLETKGIENAKRISLIESMLREGKSIEEDIKKEQIKPIDMN